MTRRKKRDQAGEFQEFMREMARVEQLLPVPAPHPVQEVKKARETIPVPVETSNQAFVEAWQAECPPVEGTGRTCAVLFATLLERGPLTRKELVTMTGLAWTTVHDALIRLKNRGLVNRGPEPVPEGGKRRHGRPKVLWRIKQPGGSEQPPREGNWP